MITYKNVKPNSLSSALRDIAWVNVVVSVILSIYLFAHVKESQYSAYMNEVVTTTNSLNLILGISILVQSFLVLLVFYAIAMILMNQQVTHYYLDKIGDEIVVKPKQQDAALKDDQV